MTTDDRRQIPDAGGMIEVVPPKTREIADVAGSAEIALGRYRQITDVALLVEIVPCVERLGDYGYADKQFCLEKLRYLNENYGSQANLLPYQGCTSAGQLDTLRRLYIDELLETDVMAPIASLLRPLPGMTLVQLWELFTRLRDGCGASPGLACIVEQGIAELDPLLRGYFTTEIRARVGDTFQSVGIDTKRLYTIFVGLEACGVGNYLCMARLGIPEVEAALTTTLIAAIRITTDGRDEGGTKFDPRGIVTSRLAEIRLGIESYTADFLATWSRLEEFPEIEEVIGARRIEKTFATLRQQLHDDPASDVGRLLDDYRAAIEAGFSVTFTKENDESYDWGLVAIHFVHLGLAAVAKAFEDWVNDRLGTCWLNRFRIFRNVMGRMTFKHVNELASNFARSEGHTTVVLRRPVTIQYYVYMEREEQRHVPVLGSDGTKTAVPEAYEPDGYIAWLPKYSSGVYGVGPMEPAGRQAVMTPNNFIHELGHSLSRFSGFDLVVTGSLEQALIDDGMPTHRLGMGKPPYAGTSLYYEHASVVMDSKGAAEFKPITDWQGNEKPPLNFDPSGYLLHDLFGSRYALWTSHYNVLPRGTARIDVFVHNRSPSPSETAADAFLNWVRHAFNPSPEGDRWRTFFDGSDPDDPIEPNHAGHMGMVLRNAAFYQNVRRMIPHYQSLGILGSPFFGVVAGATYFLRLTPDVSGDSIGQAGGLLERDNVPIYGWHRPDLAIEDGSLHWLLVSTMSGKLAWIASLGLTYADDRLTEDNKINPALLSPARPFDVGDLRIFL